MTITSAMLEQLHHVVAPLRNRIRNAIARALVTLIDDGTKMQTVQLGLDADEDRDGAERFQNYGFTSIPQPGAEAVVVFPNGDRGHALVVAVDDRRFRPVGGQAGEVAMYTDEGDQIRLNRGHLIVLVTSGEIRAGSEAAATPVALSSELAALKALIAAWTPIGGDGGASLKTVISGWVVPGSTKLKTE